MDVAFETPEQRDVIALLRQADERSASLYPAESRHGSTADALVAANVVFCVARADGRAVGCGGFVPGPDRKAELKRMFVAVSARGHGIGRSLLQAIECAAVLAGAELMQLETGVKSVEALGLYRSAGYVERGPFGSYQADPLSIFMEKHLLARPSLCVAPQGDLVG